MDLTLFFLSLLISAFLIAATWVVRRILFSIEGFRMNRAFDYFWVGKEKFGLSLEPNTFTLETDPAKIFSGKSAPLVFHNEVDIFTPDYVWGVQDDNEFIFIVKTYAKLESGICRVVEYAMYVRNSTGLRSYGNLKDRNTTSLFLKFANVIRHRLRETGSLIA